MNRPLNHLKNFSIYLGSGSPRRKELLDRLKVQYKIIKSDVEEIIPKDIAPEDAPVFLSELKASDLIKKLTGSYMLITADTVVIHQNKLLGKPRDRNEAANMLRALQGGVHRVISAVTVTSPSHQKSISDHTVVEFLPMTMDEIEWYITNENVMDKAGAYGIQDWIGLTKISNITGSYYNVMGLPTYKLYEILSKWTF